MKAKKAEGDEEHEGMGRQAHLFIHFVAARLNEGFLVTSAFRKAADKGRSLSPFDHQVEDGSVFSHISAYYGVGVRTLREGYWCVANEEDKDDVTECSALSFSSCFKPARRSSSSSHEST